MIAKDPTPADKRGFPGYWVNDLEAPNPLLSLRTDSDAIHVISALIEPLQLVAPRQAQISINIPPFPHRPGGLHLDGISVTEPSGRPGTFTLLAGLFLTDQPRPDMGNLWVWPGLHHVCATYLTDHGPDALLDLEHPAYPMAPPGAGRGTSRRPLSRASRARPQHGRQPVRRRPARSVLPPKERRACCSLARVRPQPVAGVCVFAEHSCILGCVVDARAPDGT